MHALLSWKEREHSCLPDANSVYKDATEEWKDHVRERVDGVKSRPLRLCQVVRWLLQDVLQRSWIVKTEVATHEEETSEGQHEPSPSRLPDELLLGLVIAV